MIPEANTDLKKQFQAIADSLDLSTASLSAIVAVTRWHGYLVAPSGEQRDLLGRFLSEMGYLPEDKRLVQNALHSSPPPEHLTPELMEAFAGGQWDPDAFVKVDTDRLRALYPGVTRSQAELLKAFIRHQRRLDELNVDDLRRQFPFPVTEFNFFGRFIAAGCDEPEKGVRHLMLATPFFVRMRSMLEGLSQEKYRFLVIEPKGLSADEGNGTAPKVGTFADSEKLFAIVRACINSSHDFMGGSQKLIRSPMACIELPHLPRAHFEHIEEGDRAELASQIFDWLFYNKRIGGLLDKQALSVQRESEYRRKTVELAKARKDYALMMEQHPQGAPTEHPPHVLRRIERLENDLAKEDSERSRVKPILRELEADEATMSAIGELRRQVREAEAKGLHIVFSLLNHLPGPLNDNIFYRLFDKAFTTKKFTASPGVRCLRRAAFLVNDAVAEAIEEFRVGGFVSIADQQLRRFEIDESEITSSVQYVLADILPEQRDPKLSLLAERLLDTLDLPGIDHPRHLAYLVRETVKRAPAMEDYLVYAFSIRRS